MPFWRRRKPLHEELAEGTDLLEWDAGHQPGAQTFKGTLDVLHGGRPRRWDAVATTEAPGLERDELEFTALPDGTLLFDEEIPDDVLSPLVEAISVRAVSGQRGPRRGRSLGGGCQPDRRRRGPGGGRR